MSTSERLKPNGNGNLEKFPFSILNDRLDQIFRKPETIEEMTELGITTVSKRKLSHLFVEAGEDSDDRSSVRLVNLKNVRIGETKRGIFEERVLSEALCAGIYIPDISVTTKEILDTHKEFEHDEKALRDAIKEQVYKTAEYIRRSLVPAFRTSEESPSFFIGVGLDGQMAAWEQMGFLSELTAFRSTAVSPKDVIKALFYDTEGHRNGVLSQEGLRFQTQGVMVPGLDILFVKKDANGRKVPAPISLLGCGKGNEYTPYNNVVGLACIEDDVDLHERKSHVRRINALTRHWLSDPSVQVMSVDRALIARWQTEGALISEKDQRESVSAMTPKKRVDYGFSPNEKIQSVGLFIIENRQQIGGNKLMLRASYPGQLTRAVLLDFGWSYQDEPVVSSFPNRASYAKGISPYLEAKLLPPIRRLYRTDLLEQSLDAASLQNASIGYSFIASELYHRLGWAGLTDFIKEQVPRFSDFDRLHEGLQKYEKEYYQDKTLFTAILLSHAHVDHSGGMSTIRYDVPAGMTPASAAFLRAMYRSGWHFTGQEAIIRKLREGEKRGNAYATEERPLYLFGDRQTVFLSPDMKATALYENHSIIGATGFIVDVMDTDGGELVSFGYTGDWRKGPMTDKAIQEFSRCDAIAIEGTNFENEKPSRGITEERVSEKFAAYRADEDARGGIVIIQLDGKNLERLGHVVTTSGNRTVCVPLGTAKILHELAIFNESLPRELRVAVPMLGKDVTIFKQQKMTYDPWEKQLMKTYGSVDGNDIMLDPKQFSIVVDPYKSLYTTFGTLPRGTVGTVIRSTYWPYGDQEKKLTLSNYHWCRQQKLQYITDIDLSGNTIRVPENPIGVHASGHMTKEETLDAIVSWARVGNVKTIIPLHTLTRGIFSDQTKKFLREHDVAVYPEGALRIQRGIGKGGVIVPLWERKK